MSRKKLQNRRETSSISKRPENFVYALLRLADGPAAAGGLVYDMNTNSTPTGTSKFEYTVPSGRTFDFSRVNLVISDVGIRPGDFGGINGGLATGSSLQVIGLDDSTLIDFTEGVNIQTNDDLGAMAGSDIPIAALAGDDLLPVRFSIFKAGNQMKLLGGEKIRWTNRDNLSSITKFRGMIQGTLND